MVTVIATIDGRQQKVGSTSFRVRKLPDPMPYIAYPDANGGENRYKGSKPFSKTLLLQAQGISAAIDDDMLNVAYKALNVTIDYARSKYKGTGAGKSQKDTM